jgi:uncharacterized membrane protein YfcA
MLPLTWQNGALFIIVWGAYVTQAVTGFGAVVIALSMGALFLPVQTLVAALVPLNVLLTAYLTFRYFRMIDLALLLRRLLPLMAAGVAAGFALQRYLAGDWLRLLLGLLVALLALRELFRLLITKEPPRQDGTSTSPGVLAWFFSSGIIHGIWASGGPFLVYGLSRLPLDRAAFRSTLSAVWLSMNICLSVAYFIEGRITSEINAIILFLLPALPLGLWAGEILHHRVSESRFRVATFALLLVAGGALLYKGASALVGQSGAVSWLYSR